MPKTLWGASRSTAHPAVPHVVGPHDSCSRPAPQASSWAQGWEAPAGNERVEGVRPETPACWAPAVLSCRKSPEPSRNGQLFAVASSPGPSAWSVQGSHRRQPLPCHSLTRAQRLPLFHPPPHPQLPKGTACLAWGPRGHIHPSGAPFLCIYNQARSGLTPHQAPVSKVTCRTSSRSLAQVGN